MGKNGLRKDLRWSTGEEVALASLKVIGERKKDALMEILYRV